MAIASAPTAMRAVTAPVGLQPASISDLASGPDMPKLNAEPIANSRPSRKWSTPLLSWVAVMWHLRHVMSKMNIGHDISRREVMSQMIFTHDTELTLRAACVLVNTDRVDGERLVDQSALDAYLDSFGWTGTARPRRHRAQVGDPAA